MVVVPIDGEDRLHGLIRDYGRLVRHAVRAAAGRHAPWLVEDVEQMVYLSLWQQLRQGQTIEHPLSYVYRAAVRETVRGVRRLREERPPPVAALPRWAAAPPPTPEEQAMSTEAQQALLTAVNGLAVPRRRAVRAHLHGFSVDETMSLYGWSYQKTRNLVARGMADLRRALRHRRSGVPAARAA